MNLQNRVWRQSNGAAPHNPKEGFIMNKFLKLKAVEAATTISRSHIYALAKEGKFPKPVKLSERSSAWLESEVLDWIESRIAQRNKGEAV
jgi:prophage regulatory protein